MTLRPELVTLAAIVEARERVRGVAVSTPLVPLRTGGGRYLLKAENLQPVGAFKLRGAFNAIANLPEHVRARGVVAASSGNHAQGVARAARILGIEATIVMPAQATPFKRERVRADGARIIDWELGAELGLEDTAERLADSLGHSFIHPFDSPDVIAGQGTIGIEIAEAIDDLAAVLVPIGGGGLISGIAVAIRALRPLARIIGVEPELAADARDSFRSGTLIEWPAEQSRRTIADGTRVNLSERTLAHILALVDDIVTIPEDEIGTAMRLIVEETRLVAEPSGALTAAAVAFHAKEVGIANGSGQVVAVVSGGNVAADQLAALIGGSTSREPAQTG